VQGHRAAADPWRAVWLDPRGILQWISPTGEIEVPGMWCDCAALTILSPSSSLPAGHWLLARRAEYVEELLASGELVGDPWTDRRGPASDAGAAGGLGAGVPALGRVAASLDQELLSDKSAAPRAREPLFSRASRILGEGGASEKKLPASRERAVERPAARAAGSRGIGGASERKRSDAREREKERPAVREREEEHPAAALERDAALRDLAGAREMELVWREELDDKQVELEDLWESSGLLEEERGAALEERDDALADLAEARVQVAALEESLTDSRGRQGAACTSLTHEREIVSRQEEEMGNMRVQRDVALRDLEGARGGADAIARDLAAAALERDTALRNLAGAREREVELGGELDDKKAELGALGGLLSTTRERQRAAEESLARERGRWFEARRYPGRGIRRAETPAATVGKDAGESGPWSRVCEGCEVDGVGGGRRRSPEGRG